MTVVILSFVDRQQPVVQRQSQQRQRGADGLPELPAKAAVVLLAGFQLPNQLLVPFFPGLDIALKQGLGLVVTSIFQIRRGLLFGSLRQVLQRGLVLGQIPAACQGIDQRSDR